VPTSIRVTVNGVSYTYPDHLTFIGGTLTFTPTVPWVHGSTVTFTINEALDDEGCPMFGGPTCQFTVDLRPPDLTSITPECSILLTDSLFRGEWAITEDIAGIDILNSYFTVNGVPFYMGTSYVDFTGGTFSGVFSLEGTFRQLGFLAYDSVVVCLHVQDRVPSSFCGPNDTIYCCTYFLNSPPEAYFVHPYIGTWSACDPESITLVVRDPDGNVDPSSVMISVDGTYYDISSPLMSHHDSVFVFYPYATFWDHRDSVRISLIQARDTWGVSVPDLPIHWWFFLITKHLSQHSFTHHADHRFL
jgi:hypothetical protein